MDQLETILSMYMKGKKQTKDYFVKKINKINKKCRDNSNKIKEEN